MNALNAWPHRLIALGLVILLGVPMSLASTAPQQAGQTQSNAPAQSNAPDSLGRDPQSSSSQASGSSTQASSASGYPDSPGAQVAGLSQPQQPSAVQTGQQGTTPAPVGTAAAPYENPEGTPASRPAGAAIAPAKQRRVHTFSIRTALLVGAAVAVGVVVAASLSSPSRAN